MHIQLGTYSLLYFGALFTNILILYTLVEIFHVWYVLAQVVSIFSIAIVSFFVYRHFIFPATHTTHDHT